VSLVACPALRVAAGRVRGWSGGGSEELSDRSGTVTVMTEVNYTAAWVPDNDPERGWDEAAEPVVEWVLGEAERQGAEPLLVTPTQNQWSAGPDVIAWFARTYAATTPRSAHARGGRGPVLVYVPDYHTMYLAANYARGSSLAVVETISSPLIGWAMQAKALDLLQGEVTPDTRTESVCTELDRIHFYGNNGWTTGFGKDQATQILRDLLRDGEVDPAVILGYMARPFQDHAVRPRIVNGLVMLRQAHRVASVMSARPARRRALIARLRSEARTRGPDRVRTVDWSSR
jgi:hypothetical protein